VVERFSWTLLAANIGGLLSVLRIVVVRRGNRDVVPRAGSSDEPFSFPGGPGKRRRRHWHWCYRMSCFCELEWMIIPAFPRWMPVSCFVASHIVSSVFSDAARAFIARAGTGRGSLYSISHQRLRWFLYVCSIATRLLLVPGFPCARKGRIGTFWQIGKSGKHDFMRHRRRKKIRQQRAEFESVAPSCSQFKGCLLDVLGKHLNGNQSLQVVSPAR